MVQKTLQCCSKTPTSLVTYSVSGSEKDYLVCSSCIKKECFSKYVIRQHSVENEINFFQNEPFLDSLRDDKEFKKLLSVAKKKHLDFKKKFSFF